MAEYKVAQDVEADDKLIGPFSFRQFIYLIVVAGASAIAWGLAQVFIPLAILPLPVILLFGALALPLRKDQPMEIYLAAIVSFHLKPRNRIWSPDGISSLIEIVAPEEIEVKRSKELSQIEAEQRFAYLADIADTGGWSIRHAAQPQTPATNTSMIPDQYYVAQQTEDVLDDNGDIAHNFDTMISSADAARRERMVQQMQQATETPSSTPSIDVSRQNNTNVPYYNPYPTIHQSTLQPLTDQYNANTPVLADAENTSVNPVSNDIISLANNSNLSVQTIQHEAKRIQDKKDIDGEVFISLH